MGRGEEAPGSRGQVPALETNFPRHVLAPLWESPQAPEGAGVRWSGEGFGGRRERARVHRSLLWSSREGMGFSMGMGLSLQPGSHPGAEPAERVGPRPLCPGKWPGCPVRLVQELAPSMALPRLSRPWCPYLWMGRAAATPPPARVTFWSPGQREFLAGAGPLSRFPLSRECQGSRIPGD